MRLERTEGRRGLRQVEAALRAEWRLRQRLDTMQWEDEVLNPKLNELEAKGVEGLVVQGKLVEIDDSV